MAKKIKVTRFSAGNEPSANTGRNALFIVAAVVLLITGFTIGKATAPKGKSSNINTQKVTSVNEVVNEYGPEKIVGITPTGFDHSTEGAVTAATSYVGMTPKLYFANDAAFTASVIQLTSLGYTQDFIDAISANRSTARNTYKTDPNAYFHEFPLGYRILAEEGDTVQVGVWSQVMLVAQPDFDGKTEMKLHAITLVWEKGDWKISEWVTGPGPTPRWQSPSGSLVTVEEFQQFIGPLTGGYDYVPSF